MYETITQTVRQAAEQLLKQARLQRGEILVVGCSSSEVLGRHIGSGSSPEAAQAVLAGIWPLVRERGLFLAAQCCEHLNRALIVEEECARRYQLTQVNAIPQPKAGGSFATAAWQSMERPVAVETLRAAARAGMDIGGTLIGMHIEPVVVPVHLDNIRQVGEATLICARHRPKYVGGARAVYDERLM